MIIPGSGKAVVINCTTFTFGRNTYIYGNQFSGIVRIQARPVEDLTIKVPGFSQAGIRSTKEIFIGSALPTPELQPVTVDSYDGHGILVLECGGTPGMCAIRSNGLLTVRATLGSGNPSPITSQSPDFLHITSVHLDVNLFPLVGSAYANKAILVNNGGLLSSLLVAKNLRAGSSSNPGSVVVFGAGNVELRSVTCQGPIECAAASSLFVTGNITALANGVNESYISLQSAGTVEIANNTAMDAAGE